MPYKHTQIGWLILIFVAVAVAFVVVLERSLPAHLQRQVPSLMVAAILFAVMILFASLTVAVDDRFIRIRFGPGTIRKSFYCPTSLNANRCAIAGGTAGASTGSERAAAGSLMFLALMRLSCG